MHGRPTCWTAGSVQGGRSRRRGRDARWRDQRGLVRRQVAGGVAGPGRRQLADAPAERQNARVPGAVEQLVRHPTRGRPENTDFPLLPDHDRQLGHELDRLGLEVRRIAQARTAPAQPRSTHPQCAGAHGHRAALEERGLISRRASEWLRQHHQRTLPWRVDGHPATHRAAPAGEELEGGRRGFQSRTCPRR